MFDLSAKAGEAFGLSPTRQRSKTVYERQGEGAESDFAVPVRNASSLAGHRVSLA